MRRERWWYDAVGGGGGKILGIDLSQYHSGHNTDSIRGHL